MAMSYTHENINFGRLCRLLIDAGTAVLSDFLDKQLNKTYPLKTLENILNLQQVQCDLSLVSSFNKEQQHLLYPQSRGKNNLGPASTTVSVHHLDISLICILLRNIAGICPPRSKVWDNPQSNDVSPAANIARLRIFRNSLYGHKTTAAVTDSNFNKNWNDIVQVLLQLSTKFSQQDYNALQTLPIDVDMQVKYGRLLEMWNNRESSLTKTVLNKTKKLLRSAKKLRTIEQRIEQLPTAEECTTIVKIQTGELVARITSHIDKAAETTATNITEMTTEITKGIEIESQNTREFIDSKQEQVADNVQSAIMSAESNLSQHFDKRIEQLHHHLHQVETNFTTRFDETTLISRGGINPSRTTADKLRPRNPEFKGREMILHEIKQIFSVNPRVTVYGLGGIGKTTVVTEYAHINKGKYELIRWIDAEDESLQSSLGDFAGDLDIQIQGQNTEAIAKLIFQKIKKLPSWLLIFDNATDYERIKSVLPKLDGLRDSQHILVTSRNPNWKNAIRLDIFTESEAICFIKRVCGEKNEDQDCKSLAQMLDYLPLALGHAAQYIIQHCISIKTYVEIFRNNKTKLLSGRFQLEDDSQKTVMNTWSTSEEKIKQKSEDAIKLLHWCAFLSPDNIPLKFFESALLLTSKFCVTEAVYALHAYSMVSPSFENDSIKLHRLVQFVIRCKLSLDNPDYGKQVLKPLMVMLTDQTSTYVSTPELASEIRTYLPHIRVLLSHITDDLILELFDATEQLMYNAVCCLTEIHQPHDALLIGTRLLTLQQEKYGSDHVELVNTQDQIAYSKICTGDIQGGVQLYKKNLDITERHYGKESLQAAEACTELAYAMRMSGKTHEAVSMYHSCMPIIESHYKSDSIDLAESRKDMALAVMESGDPHGALEILLEVIPVVERTYGKNSIKVAYLQLYSGIALRGLGDDQGACELYKQAISTGEKHYGSENATVAEWQLQLAISMEELGNPQDAYDTYKRIIPIYQAHYGEDHWRVAQAQTCIAAALNSLGDPDGAVILLQQAQPVIENSPGTECILMAVVHETMAQALYQQGHSEDAVPLFNKSISIKEYHPRHVDVARTLYKLSVCLESLGQHQEAREMIHRAYDICEGNNCKPHYPIMVKIMKFIEIFCSENK